MSDTHLKRLALVIGLVLMLNIGAGAMYLFARPMSPASGPPSGPDEAGVTSNPIPALPPPTVNWNPSSLTDQVATGQSKTVAVSFTSSDALSNVLIRVVPGLQPFVRVSPSSFPSIAAGQTINLSVTFSASKTSPLGTIEGTIQVRSGRTIAKPLPVTITVCRCVSRDDLLLSYPSDWQVHRSIEAQGVIILKTLDDTFSQGGFINQGAASIVFSVGAIPPSLTLIDVIADNSKGRRVHSEEPIIVAGESARRVVYTDSQSPDVEEVNVAIYLPHGDILYKIILSYNSGDPLEGQFLAGLEEILTNAQFMR